MLHGPLIMLLDLCLKQYIMFAGGLLRARMQAILQRRTARTVGTDTTASQRRLPGRTMTMTMCHTAQAAGTPTEHGELKRTQ